MEKLGLISAIYALVACLLLNGFNLTGPWIFKMLWRGFSLTGAIISFIYILGYFKWI